MQCALHIHRNLSWNTSQNFSLKTLLLFKYSLMSLWRDTDLRANQRCWHDFTKLSQSIELLYLQGFFSHIGLEKFLNRSWFSIIQSFLNLVVFCHLFLFVCFWVVPTSKKHLKTWFSWENLQKIVGYLNHTALT